MEDLQSFWLYSIAVACFIWGALGLRFALSVLVANAVLSFILFGLSTIVSNTTLLYALMLSYPLYWGLAFAGCKFLERPELPSLNVSLRLALGFTAALGVVLFIHGAFLARTGELFRITYLTDPQKRPAILSEFLQRSNQVQRCDDSYATLMSLAATAKDKEVLKVLFSAFSTCNGAAATVSAVVKPMIDNGDAADLELLLQCGLTPATEVFGHDYANGAALAYAATAAKRPEMVRLLYSSSPETARNMKYFDNMMETLKERNNQEILTVLTQLGVQ